RGPDENTPDESPSHRRPANRAADRGGRSPPRAVGGAAPRPRPPRGGAGRRAPADLPGAAAPDYGATPRGERGARTPWPPPPPRNHAARDRGRRRWNPAPPPSTHYSRR